jgi:hypothetical protein
VCDDQRGTKFLCEAVVLQVHVLHCSDNIAQCEISPMFYEHLLIFLPRCALAEQAEFLVSKSLMGCLANGPSILDVDNVFGGRGQKLDGFADG